MLRVGFGMRFVAVGLPSLGKKDKGSGIGRLQAESEVEEDEGVKVEMDEANDIENNPGHDNEGLGDKKKWGAKKAGESLGFQRKPIVAEDGREVPVW